MFKVGDRIICLEDNYGLKKGDIYIVESGSNFFMANEPVINYRDKPYVNHPLNAGFYALYNPVKITCEQDYYTWLANR